MSKQLSRRTWLHAATGLALGGTLNQAFGADEVSDDKAEGRSPSQPSSGRIFDCHFHINHFNRTIEDTIRHMDATGTEKAFILPLETGEGGVTLRSETVLHAFHQHRDRVIPFCQTDVRQPDMLERIKAYHLLGCRGIGEQKEHVPLNDRRIESIIALCDELNWPITIHFQDSANGYNQGIEEHLETYLKKYKRVRIIGHAQSFWSHISADVPDPDKSLYPKGKVKPGGLLDHLLANYPNLYADMSAGSGFNALSRDEEFTAGFFERHPQQLLYGSDCPCFDGKGEAFKGMCYATQLQDFVKRLVTDPERQEDIFFRNAQRALEGAA